MSGKPPRRPRVAWVDSWATPIDESSYIVPEDEEEEEDEEVAAPPGPFDGLEVYVLEEEAVRTIDEFVKTWIEVPQGEEQKMKFLESICSVCSTARESGLAGGFADFCRRCDLCRHLQRLIEKEPLDRLETAVREQAMLAVAALSSLQVICEDSMQRLLTACFRSVFMLPPKEKLSARNFVMTMHALDSMLQLLLLSPPTTSFPSKLQGVVKALLRFCTSPKALPRRRAMMRLHKIGDFLGKCSSLEPFGRYLLEQQRTELMLTCLELALHEVPEEDKQWVSFLMNAAWEDPISWFASVPHFVIFFRQKLDEKPPPAVRQKLLEVLVHMTRCYPHSVIMSIMLICPARQRSSMEMWEAIFSAPGMTERLLKEVCVLMQNKTMRMHFGTLKDDEILLLGLMQTLSPEDPVPAVLQDVECLKRCMRTTNFHLLWIGLKGLAVMLERPRMGLTGIILLPYVLATLRFGRPHITAAALAVCCKILRALRKRSASYTSLWLVDRLTPYLDNEAGMVRESAMKLFSVCMERVLWKHRRKMWKKVHNVLLTLYLRMSEDSPSVAKAAQEALMAGSELLWWDELQEVAHMNQTWRIRACLLQQDRKRVEERLQRSRAYLADPQASVREEAVRFIGLAAEHHRDQSEEKVNEIIAILEPMLDDAEPSVREETARTIQAVRQHLRWLQRPRDPWYVQVAHCFLPRRFWQVLKLKPEPEPEPDPQKTPEETSGSEDSSLDSAPCQSTDS